MISPLLTQPTSTTSTTASKQSIAGDFDKFLKLLTTQLQNQDPMSPMDATQFTTQLVQFSQVEQQINANKKMDELVTAGATEQKLAEISTAQSYVGKKVEALGDTFSLQDGTVDLRYALDGAAKTASAKILDANKRTVATVTLDPSAGAHTLTWNGKTADGTQLPDGNYRIAITATDATGTAVATQSGFSGTVGSVANESGVIVLKIGSTSVPLSQVTALKGAAATAS
jgi:flagellar basal-body rod modification protein FlgD